jgi:hypothetical protein
MGQQLVRRVATVWAGALLASGVIPCALVAQSSSDRAARDGLILSPVGALAPLAREPIDEDDDDQSDVWFRYGRWRYDVDDAIHTNIGITVFRRIPFASSELSLTGAYLSLSCSTCASWVLGGASLQSTLWQRDFLEASSASLALRADVGGAHYLGDIHAAAASAASTLVMSVGLPFIRESHLSAAVSPGFGIGRMYFADRVHGGARPILGAALTWTLSSGVGVNLGMQRIVIAGGPTQVGLGVGWSRQ